MGRRAGFLKIFRSVRKRKIIPEEYISSKAHDKDTCIGETFLEQNTDFSTADTIPIPRTDVERKTLPVFCPWCHVISGVAKTDVLCFNKISTASWLCRKCTDFLNEGRGQGIVLWGTYCFISGGAIFLLWMDTLAKIITRLHYLSVSSWQ